MRAPTTRQLDVLRTIAAHVRVNGYPPSTSELQRWYGWRSTNACHCYLTALERHGLIRRQRGLSRALSITPAGHAALVEAAE
jgi:repressor LexA